MQDDDMFWKLDALSNEEVLGGLRRTVGSSRRLVAEVVAHLGEVEARRLHLDAACGSMFSYCVQRLGLSEDEACRRIEVARLGRRFPAIFPLLASGDLSLSVAALLKPHLSHENADWLLAAVSKKSLQRAREALAAYFPRPDVPATVRQLPAPRRQLDSNGGLPQSDEGAGTLPLMGVHVAPGAPPAASASSDSGVTSDGQRAAGDPAAARIAEAGDSATARLAPGAGTAPHFVCAPVTAAFVSVPTAPASRIVPGSVAGSEPTVAAASSQPGAVSGGGEPSRDAPAARALDQRAITVAQSPTETAPQVPSVTTAPTLSAPHARSNAQGPRIEPLSATRYKVQFTADADLKAKLELARDLMRHAVPNGDLAAIVDRALDRLLAELMKQRFGARAHDASRPSEHGHIERADAAVRHPIPAAPDDSARTARARAAPGGSPQTGCAPAGTAPASATPVLRKRDRAISRAVRRAVVARDGLRCSWVDEHGTRCEERAWLEYDHRHPRGKGGDSDIDNVRLLCRGHNFRAAELEYGREHMERAIVQSHRHGSQPSYDATRPGRQRSVVSPHSVRRV